MVFSTHRASALTIECETAQGDLVAYTSTDKDNNISLTVFLPSTSEKMRFPKVMLYDTDTDEVNLMASAPQGEEAMMYLFSDRGSSTYSGKLAVLKKDKTDETIPVKCQVDLKL